jgi:hypothetical protein
MNKAESRSTSYLNLVYLTTSSESDKFAMSSIAIVAMLRLYPSRRSLQFDQAPAVRMGESSLLSR